MGVLRVRFHGRGGQGMKTASRILGTAAFQAGFVVQDSPTYGAERRGAPLAAFVRIGREPILERGAIERPHIVVVADDTLVDDPAAAPLAGCDEDTRMLLNSTRELGRSARVIRADFTAMALEKTGRLEALSTALGVAASRLTGLEEGLCLASVESELAETFMGSRERAKNLELAREVLALGSAWSPIPWPEEKVSVPPPAVLVELPLAAPRRATPTIYASANSPARRTGSWRQFRPVLEPDKCNRCWLCFVWCPEAAIVLDENEFPDVNYDVCKGCLLCAHECPTDAFRVEREVRP